MASSYILKFKKICSAVTKTAKLNCIYLTRASFCLLAAICKRRSRPICLSIRPISSVRWMEPSKIMLSVRRDDNTRVK
jgi:hypothetical protein